MKTYAPPRPDYYFVQSLGLVAFFAALLFGGISIASAEAPVNTGLLNNTAIKGYDPVSYFVESKPVKGSKKISVKWSGANWHFSSQANKEAFEANPEAYAPQYGGYCAWAVSQGYTAGIDPNAWDIVDGKLYLNYNKSVQADWSKDRANLIDQADKNWPEIAAK